MGVLLLLPSPHSLLLTLTSHSPCSKDTLTFPGQRAPCICGQRRTRVVLVFTARPSPHRTGPLRLEQDKVDGEPCVHSTHICLLPTQRGWGLLTACGRPSRGTRSLRPFFAHSLPTFQMQMLLGLRPLSNICVQGVCLVLGEVT